jgi:uncharacterized protein
MSDSSSGRPLPEITAVSQPFWEAAASGKLVMQRCDHCRTITWPPRPSCVECGSPEIRWTAFSGRGNVYSFTVIRQAVGGLDAKAFEPEIPYTVLWVDLEDGPRFLSNMVDCPLDAIEIGMPVEIVFREASHGIWLPKFRPSER